MKKFVFIVSFTISLLIINSCNTQNAGKENNSTKSENHNIISSSDVPPVVLASFKTKYKNAFDVKWEKAQEDLKPSYSESIISTVNPF